MATDTALTVGEAAKRVGKAKSTISRAIKAGKLSAERLPDGSYAIEPVELDRAFPVKNKTVAAQPDATQEAQALKRENEVLQQLVREQRDRIDGLEADKERVWALLEDMRGKEPEVKEPERKGLWGRLFGSVAVLVLVVGLAQPLLAAFDSGNDWLVSSEQYKAGYVAGATDAFAVATVLERHDFGWVIECVGPGTGWTLGQMMAVLEKRFADHPEERHTGAVDNLLIGLAGACQ